MHIAIPVYTSREAYDQVAEFILADDPSFKSTLGFEAYLERIQQCKRGAVLSGNIPFEVKVDPVALKAWVYAKGWKMGRGSASSYAMEKMAGLLLKPEN